ncbi:cytochrome P450 [Aspergillus leporis]|uniref:Cytochrome P450 n=1 Tax=Aspergillus leporis TaxID=41062 RepID=A0A5N5WJ98_9EURO|nr:cytochrome P450 [Aspergillus leporis]
MSETFAMMLSAAYTVGKTLTVATNYVMQDRQLLAKLQEELAVSWPDHTQGCPSQSVLEKFPYLTAVIKETLRITGGVFRVGLSLHLIPRITLQSGMIIAGTYLPAGVCLSYPTLILNFEGNYFPNHDEGIFDHPDDFSAERWDLAGSFSMAQLYICLAHILRLSEIEYQGRGRLNYKDFFVPLIDGPHI